MQTSIVSTVEAIKLFSYGFGTASGVVMLLLGLLGYFMSKKLDSLDGLSERVEQHEVRISNVEVRCGERHGKK